MSGMNIVVKMFLAVIVVIAAASGTEVVDVIEVAEDVTERGREYAARVNLDGDETALFDEQIDPETGQIVEGQVYARVTDKAVPVGALAYAGEDDVDVAETDEDVVVEN